MWVIRDQRTFYISVWVNTKGPVRSSRSQRWYVNCELSWRMAKGETNESGNNKTVLESRWMMCAFTCWMIWKERCKANFEHKVPNPAEVTPKVVKDVTKFINSCTLEPSWMFWGEAAKLNKPSIGVIKINCDASWSSTKKMGGIDVVARNDTEQVKGGLNQRNWGPGAESMEALGGLWNQARNGE